MISIKFLKSFVKIHIYTIQSIFHFKGIISAAIKYAKNASKDFHSKHERDNFVLIVNNSFFSN